MVPASPHLGGRSPRSPARGEGGRRGPRDPPLGVRRTGARLRLARTPGGPGCVLSVRSAFREGDSAMRSRVEKLRKTKNAGKELERHHPLAAPRPPSGLDPPGPPPPLPRNPAPGGKGSAAAAVPRSRDAGTRAAAAAEEAQCESLRTESSPPAPPLGSPPPLPALPSPLLPSRASCGRSLD